MFRLSSIDLTGRRILIVEADDGVAERMTTEIEQSGGIAIGPVCDVEGALALVGREPKVDCAILDIRHATDTERPIISALQQHDVALVFVTGHDDWFQGMDE